MVVVAMTGSSESLLPDQNRPYFGGSRLAMGIDTSGRERGEMLSASRRTVLDV
jgi:hypothetical protein